MIQKRHAVGLLAAVTTLAVPVAAIAGSGTDRATGGGQTLVGTQGAGNTIAFTAQGTADAAKGQVQSVNRAAGTGQSQVKFHGLVRCLVVEGNTAEIGGVDRDTGQPFQLVVVDNGQGAAAENDVILLDQTAQNPMCDGDDDDDEAPDAELARGNAQVYDAP